MGADAEGVALVPATSYGFAVAARNLALRPGDRVLVLAEEYPSGDLHLAGGDAADGAEILTVGREPGSRGPTRCSPVLDERVARRQRAERALDRRRAGRPRRRRRAHHERRRAARDRRQPVDRRDAARRRRAAARLRDDASATSGCSDRSASATCTSPRSTARASRSSRTGSPRRARRTSRASSTTATSTSPARAASTSGSAPSSSCVPMAIAALEQLHEWGVAARRRRARRGDRDDRRARDADSGSTRCPAAQRGPHMLGVRLPDDRARRRRPGARRGRLLRRGPRRARCGSRRTCTSPTPTSSRWPALASHRSRAAVAASAATVACPRGSAGAR